MLRPIYSYLLAATLVATTYCVQATDIEKEKRWAEQVEANLFDGEMIWLDTEAHTFLGIITEADDPRGYVVIVHGTGIHPDWSQVINPLRVGLVEHGYTTLSIQMPVLPNEIGHDDYQSVFPEAPARLETAVRHFSDGKPVYLAAHSLGSSMSTWTMANGGAQGYAGFIGIGMGGNSAFPEADNVKSLEKVKLPVLDLFGAEDFESVLNTKQQRAASQQHNPDYTQLMVEGANHFFDNKDAELIEAVANWLMERS